MLSKLILGVGEIGRTIMAADREAFVRIVDPHQYRAEVRNLFPAKINDVTSVLGPDQRAVNTGLDIEVNRVRRGD